MSLTSAIVLGTREDDGGLGGYTMIKPGAYRELFRKGLLLLVKQPGTPQEKIEACQHYLRLLEDSSYKFGQYSQGYGSGRSYGPGELFMRS